MEISLREYAERRGISARRAQQLVAAGELRARWVGRQWLVEERTAHRRRHATRPLGERMTWALIGELSGTPTEDLHPTEVARVREYAAELRKSDDPAALLASWLRRRAIRTARYNAEEEDVHGVRGDPRIVLSGVSDERSNLSTAPEVEGYIHLNDVRAVVREHLLVENGAPANVTLHLVERAISRPVPLGLVLADLADWNGPRESGRVRDILAAGN